MLQTFVKRTANYKRGPERASEYDSATLLILLVDSSFGTCVQDILTAFRADQARCCLWGLPM